MKRVLFLTIPALSLAFITTAAQADLVKDVDQLSPEQAYEVMTKLQAKVLQPIPETFFTRLTVSVDGGAGAVNPKSYNDYLTARGGNKVNTLGVGKARILWRVSDNLLFGAIFSGSMSHQTREQQTGVYYRHSLLASSVDLALGYRIALSENFFIAPTLGAGGVFARVTEATTNDTNSSTYVLRYMGMAPHAMVELPIYYRLNRVWSIGFTNAVQVGNIAKFYRAEDRRSQTPNLSVTGYQGTLSIAFNL